MADFICAGMEPAKGMAVQDRLEKGTPAMWFMKSVTKAAAAAARQELIYQRILARRREFNSSWLAPAKLAWSHHNTSSAKIQTAESHSLVGSDSIAVAAASIQPRPINIQFCNRRMPIATQGLRFQKRNSNSRVLLFTGIDYSDHRFCRVPLNEWNMMVLGEHLCGMPNAGRCRHGVKTAPKCRLTKNSRAG